MTCDSVVSLYVYLIYVAHDHPLDGLVPQDLPCRRALAASHDEDCLRAEETAAKDQRMMLISCCPKCWSIGIQRVISPAN